MDNKLRQELFALIEYCKIYGCDIGFFGFSESPDLQSKQLDIGIEETSAVLPGEHLVIGEVDNQKNNREKFDKLTKTIEELEYKFHTATAPSQWDAICMSLDNAEKKRNALRDKLCFAYATSTATDPFMLIEKVDVKTKKLNGLYNNPTPYIHFKTNVLFMRVSSNFAGCNYFTMPKVEEFTNELKDASFCEGIRFNPIILSQSENQDGISNGFHCWIINTKDYTIIEHQGKRTLSKDEHDIIQRLIKQKHSTY